MRARLKRIERLIARIEAELAEQADILSAAETRGEDATAARNAVVSLTIQLDHHTRAREADLRLWDRIQPAQKQVMDRMGTRWGRRSDRHSGD